MKKISYLLFSLLCVFVSSIVFAKDEITIEKMIPVYDENSGVIVAEENGIHSVIFNDSDQSVKYNIVLKNNTKRDISLNDIVLPKSPEEFFKYEFVGIDENTVLEPNSTKDVVLSLETVKTEGWGRNFTLDLTGKVEVLGNVLNPNTAVKEIMVVLTFTTFVTGILVITVKNRKVSKYVALIVMVGSLGSVTNAKDSIILPIKLNVSFESQNVMKSTSCVTSDRGYLKDCGDYWDFSQEIQNIYIQNEMIEIVDYDYKFDMSLNGNERIVAYLIMDESELHTCVSFEREEFYDCYFYDLYLQADGLIYANPDSSYYFNGMWNLNYLGNLQGLDTSNVVNMSYFFSGAGRDSTVFELDVSHFDTSNVTNMTSLFSSAGKKSSTFELDLSNFDTSNVTTMKYMLDSVGYSNPNFQLDVSNFDTSNVTDMRGMFWGVGYMSPDFTLNLSNFDTSKVTDMSYMFAYTGYKSNTYRLDLSNFDTSNVTEMWSMFDNAARSSTEIDFDISSFDTSNVTNMSSMFNSFAYNYDKELTFDLTHFDTSNVIKMNQMFSRFGYNVPKLRIDVSSFNTSNVTDMSFMFSETGYNSNDFELDIRHFDTSKVRILAAMFSYTAKMNPNFKLYLKDNFDISAASNLNGTFEGLGYSSGNINISVLVSKPTATTYDRVFSKAAIASGAKITVNYTSETSALVDKLLKTKSSNSNVVKGVQIN